MYKTLENIQVLRSNLFRSTDWFSEGKMVRIDTEIIENTFIKGFLNIKECFIALGNLFSISIECV